MKENLIERLKNALGESLANVVHKHYSALHKENAGAWFVCYGRKPEIILHDGSGDLDGEKVISLEVLVSDYLEGTDLADEEELKNIHACRELFLSLLAMLESKRLEVEVNLRTSGGQ